ncbi:MAG: ParB/RepB/Spo0J family partition protein [Clostridia bacterium]|nr:ParB/RepB/Spo0J family partition protein [Clostridia bacterium]
MIKAKENLHRSGSILLIPQDEIVANPDQPRKYFDPKELKSLAQSIRLNGILQPISVRKLDNGRYEVIAGERRLRAARMAGLPKIPCIMLNATDEKAALYALIENLQRRDLNFFEEATAIDALIHEHGLSQDEAAKKLGKAQSTLSNKLRLLKLPEDVRKTILEFGLTERHARALLKIEDSEILKKALQIIIEKNLNVSQSEKLIENLLVSKNKKKPQIVKLFKDVRIFVNTLNHAVDTMREAGIQAESEKKETDDYIEYLVRIPKKPAYYISSSRSSAV